MILDSFQRVSTAQALTATGVSTDSIDLGNQTPARDIGNGEPMQFVVNVNVAADATSNDETYAFEVITSASGNLSSPTVIASRDIPRAQLTAGSLHHIPIPKGAITQRYLGMRYVLGGTTPSITVTSYLQPVAMSEARATYQDGFTIS
jgi:hypothetical protein